MKFPTTDEFCQSVAKKALDEYIYNDKTIREWVNLILNQQERQEECEWCSEFENNRKWLVSKGNGMYEEYTYQYCPMCGKKLGDYE